MKLSVNTLLPGLVASAIACLCPVSSEAAAGWEDSGVASWYGGWHDGRRTSSGAVFDQNAMTAASPSIPMGSRVKVTLQGSGRSVVVLVNDRQSPRGGRILDLSRGAAQRIGMVAMGHGLVTVKPTTDDIVEVAEATDGDVNDYDADFSAVKSSSARRADADLSSARRGQRHTRRGGQLASAGHP
jgi:rare lipoprotein A